MFLNPADITARYSQDLSNITLRLATAIGDTKPHFEYPFLPDCQPVNLPVQAFLFTQVFDCLTDNVRRGTQYID
jgi:hypothetical protein